MTKKSPEHATHAKDLHPEGEEFLIDHPSAEELMKQLTETEEKLGQHWDRILRMQAEADNASRRTERDIASAHKFALEGFVNALLPIVDNLERAIQAVQETPNDTQAILEGLELTLQMFHNTLAKFGVQQLDPVNEAFNPTYHEAVSTVEAAGQQPGTVVSVLQKGYVLNERLVRPAMVIVAK